MDPHTPTRMTQGMESPVGSPVDSPVFRMKHRDLHSALEAIKQLETELEEFQTSSYELEKELEQELDSLERENDRLKQEVEQRSLDLEVLKEESAEFKHTAEAEKRQLLVRVKELEKEVEKKQRQLVESEIQNEDFQQQERNLASVYREAMDKYELSEEKNVLVETELSSLKDDFSKEVLAHQNTRNELAQLKKSIEEQGKSNSTTRRINRSNSLRQLHSMLSHTTDMENKLENIKHSLHGGHGGQGVQRKTSATTVVSNVGVVLSTEGSVTSVVQQQQQRHRSSNHWWKRETEGFHTISQSGSAATPKARKPARRKIPLSPSSFTLSSLASKLTGSLDTIEGSPSREKEKKQAEF